MNEIIDASRTHRPILARLSNSPTYGEFKSYARLICLHVRTGGRRRVAGPGAGTRPAIEFLVAREDVALRIEQVGEPYVKI